MMFPLHFSIGGRVAMGFSLVLLILVVQGLAAITALRTSVDHFLAFQHASATTSLIHAMESNVVELKRSVLAYTFSGYEGVLSRIQRVQDELTKQFEQIRPGIQDQRRQDLLKRMEDHFRSHAENFSAALEEHRLRDRLVEHEVDIPARAASKALETVLEQAMDAGQYHFASHIGIAQEHLLISHRDALAFQSSPDSALVRNVERQLRLFNERWQSLSGLFPDEMRKERADAVGIQVARFENGFNTLTRATRAYLYMVHVVMAGEEVEFARLTAELKEATQAVQTNLNRRMNETITTAQRDAVVFTLTAILLGGVLAWRISQGISRPVIAMTHALTGLAQGETVAEIPGRGRHDEIGSMAKAADIFKQKADALENASRYKSEFLANMSHELRTPLNSLLILSKLLASNQEGNLNDDQVDSAQIIYESGSDLLSMINDILDLSKVEAGRMEVVAESLEVDRFLEGVYRQFHHMAAARGLTLRVTRDTLVPHTLTTDWVKVEHIMRNLLSNALKFTEKGEVSIRIGRPGRSVVFVNRTLEGQAVVALAVTDTGIGIPIDMQALIFDAFRQVDGTASRKYGGTGLGLSISRKFAQLLGGELQVESDTGEGSTFTLYLPEAFPWPDKTSGDHGLLDDRAAIDQSTDFHLPHVTVLVVDDDARNSQAIGKLLQGRVSQVLIANNGAEALHLLEACQKVDLVLMDIMMPVMDGYQAIQEIRRQRRFLSLPIIALTAKAMPGDRQRCLEAGANDYLSKPVRIEQLFRIMQELLSGLPHDGHSLPPDAHLPEHVAAPVTTAGAWHELPSSMNKKALTVLVVDDDMRTVFSVARALQTRIATVLLAADGEKALKELQRHPEVDAILMDIRMPNLDGYETMRRIRGESRFQQVALLAVTACAMPGDAEKCLEAGADDYLAKPASMEMIWSKLAEVLSVRANRMSKEPIP